MLLAAKKLPALVPSVRPQALKHDFDLKRPPVAITPLIPDQRERVTVIPDGVLDLLVTGVRQRRQVIVLEVDRGTEAVKDFKRQIRALLAFLGGPYQATFGTSLGKIAIVVDTAAFRSPATAARRVNDLRRCTEEELTTYRKQALSSWFHFRDLPRGRALDPIDFFITPSWSIPFCPSPVSLLSVSECGVERGSTDLFECGRQDESAVSPARAIR